MKIAFYVFSASGNTRKVCGRIAEELIGRGNEVSVFSIAKNAKIQPPAEFDAVCIAYPVHGFNAPVPVLNFAKSLQSGRGKGYYIVKTSGEPLSLNDDSSRVLRRIMARHDYIFKGEFHYVMPYNMIFRHSDKMAALMWRAACNVIPSDAGIIAASADKSKFEDVGGAAKAARRVFAVEHVGMPLLGRFYRVDEEKCLHCGKCVKACPVGNISVKDGKIAFGKNCVGCSACAFNCPVDAVRTGILNKWKVNGAYDFGAESPDDATETDVCAYCHKAYMEYFASHGVKIAPAKE